MKKQTLNEQTSRIKQIMGLNENMGDVHQTEPDATATDVFDTNEEMTGDSKWITPETVADDRGFYSDMYKEINGFRPHEMSNEELCDWLNNTYELHGNNIVLKPYDNYDENDEPTDDQIYNGPGMEGGISYSSGGGWQGR